MAKTTIHFLQGNCNNPSDRSFDHPLCLSLASKPTMTLDPNEVTCEKCRKSLSWLTSLSYRDAREAFGVERTEPLRAYLEQRALKAIDTYEKNLSRLRDDAKQFGKPETVRMFGRDCHVLKSFDMPGSYRIVLVDCGPEKYGDRYATAEQSVSPQGEWEWEVGVRYAQHFASLVDAEDSFMQRYSRNAD